MKYPSCKKEKIFKVIASSSLFSFPKSCLRICKPSTSISNCFGAVKTLFYVTKLNKDLKRSNIKKIFPEKKIDKNNTKRQNLVGEKFIIDF